ncbi:MAG TPA: GNAT family N-acetyltransferase [Candidatus Limnocylindrales bacterium]|jgi:CelD/BcsL family acetyltransferase involved in cellulose biosynthesis|nr:GNAT family N-acetyltransferase [Candidatus Limnocylindrales bacterium]
MVALRPIWEELLGQQEGTIFQSFDWNLLAARMFAEREEPRVVFVRTSYGMAIIPAARRSADRTIRFLGEELFDYRCPLFVGDPEIVNQAFSFLSASGDPLEVAAVRDRARKFFPPDITLEPFCHAPCVRHKHVSPEQFMLHHSRLPRNLRRLERLGFELKHYSGDASRLIRTIYQRKAEQDRNSLFTDPLRVEFMVNAALLAPEAMDVFTLEWGSELGAALVTLREPQTRRFYTCWFDGASPTIAKHSPSLSLIHEVTRRSLEEGLDCDYMTGEQPYKLRLATDSVPLFRARASAEQLELLAESRTAGLRVA